ncbi:hypothetical protein BE11_29795 [Sorangium cellulosum]|nr:hypothetical protein BE11_29795 [Sorangium cellulosum]
MRWTRAAYADDESAPRVYARRSSSRASLIVASVERTSLRARSGSPVARVSAASQLLTSVRRSRGTIGAPTAATSAVASAIIQ